MRLENPAPQDRSVATPSLSVVLPAYNEAQSLPLVLAALADELPRQVHAWEVIVVDDGSVDDTRRAVAPWLQRPGWRYLGLSRNFGKEAALTAGLDRAEGDIVLIMDADGQHPVAMIAQMLEAWRRGADTVCAVRETRMDESRWKRFGARVFFRMTNAGSPVPIPPGASDFRLMDRRVVDALCALPERNRFMKGLYAWVGFETAFMPYTPDPRFRGASTFSWSGLARLAVTGVTAFSNLPLRMWSAIGTVIALGALAYGAWIVVEHLVDAHPVPGWATLVASLMFFSGVQLLSIGILGEYIGRVFDEVKRRPIYVVAREEGHGLSGPDRRAGGPSSMEIPDSIR